MDRKLNEREGAVMGRKTIEGMRQKLVNSGLRLGDVFRPDDIEDFCLTAWHLFTDWLPAEKDSKYRLARQKANKSRLPEEMVLLINVLRDIANGGKHVILKPEDAKKRVIIETHSGQTAGYYQYFFHERIEGVTTIGNYYFSGRKIHDLTVRYFEWVFDDAAPAQQFPGLLLGDIWLCCPAHRSEKSIPPSGSIVNRAGDKGFVTVSPSGK